MKPCFGYVRVSTVKQGDGVSLEAQKDAILEYARRKNLTITQWWEEKETAAKQGRPVFNEMVARLKHGEAKGLVIHIMGWTALPPGSTFGAPQRRR